MGSARAGRKGGDPDLEEKHRVYVMNGKADSNILFPLRLLLLLFKGFCEFSCWFLYRRSSACLRDSFWCRRHEQADMNDSLRATPTAVFIPSPTGCVLFNGTLPHPYVVTMGYAAVTLVILSCIFRAQGFSVNTKSSVNIGPPTSDPGECDRPVPNAKPNKISPSFNLPGSSPPPPGPARLCQSYPRSSSRGFFYYLWFFFRGCDLVPQLRFQSLHQYFLSVSIQDHFCAEHHQIWNQSHFLQHLGLRISLLYSTAPHRNCPLFGCRRVLSYDHHLEAHDDFPSRS
ncbi:hypothetical protein B0H10DRAFT_1228838 [Mycena sp. CBHHK59/15]|nr:hypothetical protein B0H10DRAFT_1228838 [Mycena sp. CBHHK59/15]